MSNSNAKKGGMIVGKSHADGGVPFVVKETKQPIEAEGGEPLVPFDAIKDNKIITLEGTNKDIINEINNSIGAKDLSDKATEVHSGDFIVCKRSARDNTKRKITGTKRQIISAINSSGGCNHVYKGALVDENGIIKKFSEGGKLPSKISVQLSDDIEYIENLFYHGTDKDFNKFESEFYGKGEGSNKLGSGVYISKTEKFAKEYGKIIKNITLNKDVKLINYDSIKYQEAYDDFLDNYKGDRLNAKESFARKYYDGIVYGSDEIIIFDNKNVFIINNMDKELDGTQDKIYTLDLHKKVENDTFDGKIKVEDFKRYFQLALASEKQITEELSKFSKDQLIKYANSYTIRPSDKKDDIISHIYSDIVAFFALGSYSWSWGSSKYEGIISKVNKFTQKDLDEYAVEVAKKREEYKKRVEEHKKALSNPETLQEFQEFIRYKGKDQLTSEQKTVYDELIGLNTKEKQSELIEKKAVVSKVNVGENVDFNIYETKHTKTNQPLFVVKLSERVSKETYMDLNSKAKKLGGFYSSYTKDGAIAGFQFKSREDAEKFVSLKQGDVSNIERIEEIQDLKTEKRAEKLRENAEKIIERVDKELSKDRQTNTARRASMASSIESRLNGEKSIAKTMINLANAIELGETKFLDLVRTKAQVEQLNAIVANANYNYLRKKYTSYSEYEAHKYDAISPECIDYISPHMSFFPLLHTGNLQRVVYDNQNKSGLKLISNKIQKYINKAKDEYYQIKDKYEMADFLEFTSKLEDNWDNSRVLELAKNHNRLKSLGIESNEMLRALLREFIQYKEGVQEVDKVKTLERGLAGKKVGIDFFPTPPSVCIEMVELAEITEGMDVLEPSAGNGNIADAIKNITGVVCDVCEVSSELRAILEAKGYNVVDFDFLSYEEKKYDRILMNPPFSNRMDAEHIRHAYSLLKPNGRIVAIAGEGVFIGSDKKAVEFKEWLDDVSSEVQKLPEKTFTDKSLYATTGANARLIVINKDVAEEISEKFDVPNEEIIDAIKIESEHKDTLEDVYDHKLNPEEAVEKIVTDHLSESKDYYDSEIGLPNMEKELQEKNDSCNHESSISKIVDNKVTKSDESVIYSFDSALKLKNFLESIPSSNKSMHNIRNNPFSDFSIPMWVKIDNENLYYSYNEDCDNPYQYRKIIQKTIHLNKLSEISKDDIESICKQADMDNKTLEFFVSDEDVEFYISLGFKIKDDVDEFRYGGEIDENYIFNQFYHQPVKAIKHLMETKRGECIGALYRKDIGDIDIIWGEQDYSNVNKGCGLKHIICKHGLQLKEIDRLIHQFIPDIIENTKIIESKKQIRGKLVDRLLFENDDFRIVVEKKMEDIDRKWILTAFDLRKNKNNLFILNDKDLNDFIQTQL